MAAEQVVIDILARDNASNVISRIKSELESLSQLKLPKIENVNIGAVVNQVSGVSSQINQASAQVSNYGYNVNSTLNGASSNFANLSSNINQTTKVTAKFNETLTETGKKGKNTGEEIENGISGLKSTFHEMTGIMESAGNKLNDFSSQIAGLFGATGLTDLLGKLWEGAAQRQQNMMYLMHQKGVSQANEYYNEIMSIVTELPGDDTFLTNILNMASAMDSSLKLDNLKEAGTAITDYYMAATMKGENSYETQKDIRKYVTTGDTRGMRNSVLASELDLLKNKNSVLERTQALEKALEKTGFSGMSEYESAMNELEEFKGHFQKAFADLGTIITSITQPLLKFYNTMDTIFGGRISQIIIIIGMLLISFFAIMGTGLLFMSAISRNLEIIGGNLKFYGDILKRSSNLEEFYILVLKEKLGLQNLNIKTELRELSIKAKQIIATSLNIEANNAENISILGLTWASLGYIKTKLLRIASSIKHIILGYEETVVEAAQIALENEHIRATMTEAMVEDAERIVRVQGIHIKIMDRLEDIKSIAVTIWKIVVKGDLTVITEGSVFAKILDIIATKISITVTYEDGVAHIVDAEGKEIDTVATLGLATATVILDAVMSPLVITILAIVGAVLLVVTAIEKLGEAFGWWKDFGSMFQAIGEGINRIWSAFANSDVVQGIIKYFQNFFDVVKYLFDSIMNMFGLLFGWSGDTGTLDIVQTIINVFGKLGDIIMWVWKIFDDWSNSPLGIVTWLNPLGILIFHLDEIGSLFEDIGDAINRFVNTEEFQALSNAIGEVWSEIQEPFQEIWELINEIMGLFGELFDRPEGNGTEDRINFIVEILKGLATIIRVLVIPSLRGVAFAIKVILLPLRVTLTVIKAIIGAIQWATQSVSGFMKVWYLLTTPLVVVQSILQGIGNVVNQVSDAIKNSFIGKLLGWDKEDNKDKGRNEAIYRTQKNLHNNIYSSDIDPNTKKNMLSVLDNQRLVNGNVNNVRNLGQTYNNTNNQRQVVINQNFAEGSMPIDARNMTKKEARKMFIGAFGYRRAVGSKGILK